MTALQARMALGQNDLRRLTVAEFLRMDRKGMTNADLKYQKVLRLGRVRAWLSLMLPHEKVAHLGLTNFNTSLTHVRSLIREVESSFVAEAAEFETQPIHERRHSDRMMLQGLFLRAVENNKLQAATSCAKMLIALNGTMPVSVDESSYVSDETQAARGLPDDLLAEIERTGRGHIADVPQLEDEEPDAQV